MFPSIAWVHKRLWLSSNVIVHFSPSSFQPPLPAQSPAANMSKYPWTDIQPQTVAL